jgi:N-methylhydantoinase B
VDEIAGQLRQAGLNEQRDAALYVDKEHVFEMNYAPGGGFRGSSSHDKPGETHVMNVRVMQEPGAGDPDPAAVLVQFTNPGHLNVPVSNTPFDGRSGSTSLFFVHRLADVQGLDTLLAAIGQNLDRSEARMREKLARLPDGVYYHEDYLETFGEGGLEPLLLPLTLTIRRDALIADFTGASTQVPVPVNSTLAVTAASVFIALKSILDPDAPLNHGSFRPITVIAPEGTVVNVRPPAPAGSHGEIRKRVIAVMVGALAQVVPELVAGDLFRTSFHNLVGGIHPQTGKQYVHYEWASGGNGAFAEDDGPSAMASIDWGDLNTVQPTEVLETRFPLRIEASALATDSGGDGRQRGGLAMRREIRLTAPEATYSVLADGAVLPAFGILGGGSAVPVGSHVVRGGRELRFDTPGKVSGFRMKAGDLLVLQSAGGGGYGDPLERDPERVLADLRAGYVSPERRAGAKAGPGDDVYGVGRLVEDVLAAGVADDASAILRLAAVACQLPAAERPADAGAVRVMISGT